MDKPTPPPCRLVCECGAQRFVGEPDVPKNNSWICRLFTFLFGKI